jgi:putative nucleotidyltransferase with HDIG domain
VSKPHLTRQAKTYLACVILLGGAAVAASLLELARDPIGFQWFILAALTVVSGSASVRLPSSPASISISETFVITGTLLYGPAAGTILTALDGLVISFWMSRRRPELHRALFNVSAPALSAWCSAHLFFFVAGIPPLVQKPASINAILPALLLFAFTYFALNSWLVTFVIAIERKANAFKIWKGNFVLLSLNYFAGASVAILFVGFTRTIDLGYIGIIVPLLLVLYFTFKATMSRVEDANKHVDDLNKLYLSTIETFAMAIDAKDQVTHGHIRRVQQYAIALAHALGVEDQHLLKAIEAAALLHDMGKLAVPEYILNKPGKLTASEFDKMKLHAGVGADILSAVEFPYPVVPIVRHHHENWDGTGYPGGLRGTDIPIGARILSVVDCFDALTSDRPYRPRLSDDDALRIVIERRGTMYDPMIVDTFVRVYREARHESQLDAPLSLVMSNIVTGHREGRRVLSSGDETTASNPEEMRTFFDLGRGLAGPLNVNEVAVVVATHLRRLVPAPVLAFFVYDKSAGEIELRHSFGEWTGVRPGLRIPLGQRLSGWVAANRQTISNSDPILDTVDPSSTNGQRLRSCLSTPIVCDESLVGVLSLYSCEASGFDEKHRHIVELVASYIAEPIRLALERSEATLTEGIRRYRSYVR